MLIERIRCPYGCENSIMTESKKQIVTGSLNLLLDSMGQSNPVATTNIVSEFTCSCCGKTISETKKRDSRMVL
jgi:hypothetical protein